MTKNLIEWAAMAFGLMLLFAVALGVGAALEYVTSAPPQGVYDE